MKYKCLVCGHWHVSDFHRYLDGNKAASNTIYYSDNLIGLDLNVDCKCPSCGNEFKTPFRDGPEFFGPEI